MRLRAIIREGIRIEPVSTDDGNWEVLAAIEQCFMGAHIRPGRNKEPILGAFLDGRPVGGVYAVWYEDTSDDEPIWVFDFDVAVAPEDRKYGITGLRNTAPIGLRLIEAAIGTYQEDKDIYGNRTMMRLWVVNDRLARLLERQYGFEVEGARRGDSAHLVRY